MSHIDLQLPDTLRKGPGRPGPTLIADLDRPLTKDDIVAVITRPQTTSVVQRTLKEIRAVHHNIARMLAGGLEEIQVAAICGRSPKYIRSLKNDPAFQELLTHYSSIVEQAYANVHEQLAAVNQDAISELGRRLEEEPENLTVEQLMGVIKLASDRTGHGPTSTVRTIDAGDILREIKELADGERQGTVINREDIE